MTGQPTAPASLGVTSLSELLDRDADHRAHDEALTDGRVRLTWSEYRSRATNLAAALVEAGVRPGDRVGVHLPKSVWSFVAVHAVLRAGAVVVPIDWFAPPAYAAEVLADAGAAALLSTATGARLDLGRGGVAPVVDPSADHPPGGEIRVISTPNDPAYVIYTSGSTGRPKGIVHTHASALAYATFAARTYELSPNDRLANIAPLHFDQSTFELYAAPLAGAAVVVVPDAMMRFPASLGELIEVERVTVWYSVPYAISQLVARGAIDRRDLSSLRWVLFGGESFPPAILATAMRALPSARFSNVYGPAEVNQCTYHHLDSPPSDDRPVPIGRAWEGAALRVVDDELWVASTTMMREYWNRPDLTAAAIVDDDLGRWYRTGDLVSERDDGALVFVGRVDHQVKVRGHRIEIEAVEATILDQPGVEACAVVVERAADGDDVLVAVVSPPLDDAETGVLARSLAERLPRFAVPSRIVGVESMPRTGTGKVDRHAAQRMSGSPI